jgi:hypothetical protein
MVEWLIHLLHFSKVPGSILVPETNILKFFIASQGKC